IGQVLSVRAEVGQYLPDWHPEDDYGASYAAQSRLGGGAVLTLSHELDYVRWIVGEVTDVRSITMHASSLGMDVEDVAEVLTRHSSGALASIHMDFLDRSYNRRSRWIGEEGTISWEWTGPVLVL